MEKTDRSKLLLHVCCAPCSGAILERLLQEGDRPVVFFSNSNIVPKEEYDLRLSEVRRYASSLGVEVIEDEYNHEAWLEAVKGFESAPERGERCLRCFRFRLGRAAAYAAGSGFTLLSTSLASSRWKSLAQVDEAGSDACSGFPSLEWWGRNWRKGGLQERRNAIIRECAFYNQRYCGCEFSEKH